MQLSFAYPPTLDWERPAGHPSLFQRPQQLARAMARRGHTWYHCQDTQRPGVPPEPVASDPGVFLIHDFSAFREQLAQHVLFISWSQPAHGNFLGPTGHALHGAGRLTVFDYLDDFAQWGPANDEMLAKADLVFYTATKLGVNAMKIRGERPSFWVPNACDPALWRGQRAEPACLANIPRPRLLFVGYVGEWVDHDLMLATARALPGCHLVVVGWPGALGGVHDAQRPANLHLLGTVPHHDLPAIAQHCDVGLVPFRNEHPAAQAADPIKAYEYLAAGLPVVSTDIPEMRNLRPLASVVDAPEFAAEVGRALQPPDAENRAILADRRRLFAESHSWAARAEVIDREVLAALAARAEVAA